MEIAAPPFPQDIQDDQAIDNDQKDNMAPIAALLAPKEPIEPIEPIDAAIALVALPRPQPEGASIPVDEQRDKLPKLPPAGGAPGVTICVLVGSRPDEVRSRPLFWPARAACIRSGSVADVFSGRTAAIPAIIEGLAAMTVAPALAPTPPAPPP